MRGAQDSAREMLVLSSPITKCAVDTSIAATPNPPSSSSQVDKALDPPVDEEGAASDKVVDSSSVDPTGAVKETPKTEECWISLLHKDNEIILLIVSLLKMDIYFVETTTITAKLTIYEHPLSPPSFV